jgi:predicted NodU family carbamoyl transferase
MEIYGIKNNFFKKEELVKTKFKDIAARLQYCTENTILKLAQKTKKLSKSDNLCIA